MSHKRRVQHEADLLRIMLLHKFGGVWADARILPVAPLDHGSAFVDRTALGGTGSGPYFVTSVVKVRCCSARTQ